jgi:LuxR family maltose regulon positive regulatory protein
LYIPPLRANLVPRPRLIARLEAGLEGRLTLISAPAGYGKTTLVAEWLQAGGHRVAWLSLDENDNDPRRFLAYLLAALRQVQAEIGQVAEAMLQSPQPPPSE